jgi:guanine deaminase
MDRNAPDFLREPDAAFAVADTERWIAGTAERFANAKPILTPRFVPSCTPETMAGLGELKRKWNVPVQSHLDETPEEIAWVRELCPDAENYAAVYDRDGLLGPDTVMAHCIYLTEPEIGLLKERGVFIAHCPASNMNVRSGIAPVRKYLDAGLNIGLGTDISGGHTLDMAQAVRDALSVSRLLWRLGGGEYRHLTAEEAFWLATAGGGAFFGNVGKFEPGYEFDAVAVDDSAWRWPGDDLDTRFRKFIYAARAENVVAKYVAGKELF